MRSHPDGPYKIFAASIEGSGSFTLKVKELGPLKIHDVGTGFVVKGDLVKASAVTYNVKLESGKTYVVDMLSADQKVLDPFLRLLDAEGNKLAEDDDGGEGLDARILFHAKAAGTYQVVATYIGKGRGSYSLSMREARDAILEFEKQWGKAHWKVIDFRLALTNAQLLADLDAERRALLVDAKTLCDKADTLTGPETLQDALKVANEALKIRTEVLGEKHPECIQIMTKLAYFYMLQGDYVASQRMHRQALEIRRQILGDKHPDYGLSLWRLGIVCTKQENYAKAEPLLLRAVDVYKEARGEGLDYADCLYSLAFLYQAQGQYAKAEPISLKALSIRKEVLGEKHRDYAWSLHRLGVLHWSLRNYEKAESMLLKCMELRKEVLGEKHADYAWNLSVLGRMYGDLGRFAEAEDLLLKALEIRKVLFGEGHPEYASSLNSLALIYEFQGRYDKAEPLYRQALVASQVGAKIDQIDRMRADDFRPHASSATFLGNYARLMHQFGTSKSASKYFRSSDKSYFLALSVLNRVHQEVLDEKESRIHLTDEVYYLYPRRIKVLKTLFSMDQNAQDLEAAYSTAEQGTARAFLQSLGNTRASFLAGVSIGDQAEEVKLVQNLRLLDVRLDKELQLKDRDPDLIASLFMKRRDIETKLSKLEERIKETNPQYAAFKYPRPSKLNDARSCLSCNEIALLLVPGAGESLMVLVEACPKPDDKANGIAIIELPGAATLAEHVAALTDPETLSRTPSVKAYGRQAFDAILGPLKDRIKNKNLVIVPNGQLCFLPFEMLVEPDGKYLVEKHRIRYAPSLTALHFINLWKHKRAKPEETLFAVGDPVYGKDYQRLEHSGYEVAEIAKLLKAKDEFVLTRGKASKAAVKKLSDANTMSKAKYVHFATHGILGLDRGKQPALVLNQTGKDVEESYLQMDEITGLKLNADLVVLSACKSGQGQLHQGEGVTGIARAFLYAGSKGVMCSLWSVDDRETANLMVDFYGHLQRGKSAPEALRAAQLAMIRAGKAPLYWAPFIVIGE